MSLFDWSISLKIINLNLNSFYEKNKIKEKNVGILKNGFLYF
jgi:hypothetical protein